MRYAECNLNPAIKCSGYIQVVLPMSFRNCHFSGFYKEKCSSKRYGFPPLVYRVLASNDHSYRLPDVHCNVRFQFCEIPFKSRNRQPLCEKIILKPLKNVSAIQNALNSMLPARHNLCVASAHLFVQCFLFTILHAPDQMSVA